MNPIHLMGIARFRGLKQVFPRFFAAIAFAVLAATAAVWPAPAAHADFEISPGVSKRRFGAAMALAETGTTKLLAISAPVEAGGRVRVFRSVDGGPWQFEALLTTNIVTTNPFFLFGSAMAMRADSDGTVLLAVGAPLVGDARGQVFIFRRTVASAWAIQQTVGHPAAQPGDLFGSSVAISPDLSRIAIGASHDNPQGAGSGNAFADGRGSVLVLRRVNDDYIVSSFASTGIPGEIPELIGSSVAFGSGTGQTPELLIGAPRGRNASSLQTGKVHVLRERPNRSWQFVKSIVPSAPGVQLRECGSSISATATRAVVGAPASVAAPAGGTPQSGAGAAFMLKKVNGVWSVDAQLVQPASAVPASRFGNSVSIDGTAVAVGTNAERACLYRRDNTGAWRLLDDMRHASGSVPRLGENFGSTVALGAGQLAVGSPLRDFANVVQNGSVALFDVVPTKFFSAQPTAEGFFGDFCAISGSRAVVSGYSDIVGPPIPGNSQDGLVRIMDRSNGVWVPEFTQTAFDRNTRYGEAVAIPNDATVVVGAPGRGAFEVLERTGPGQWIMRQRVSQVLAPGAPSNGLGSSVAAVVDDGQVLVAAGAPNSSAPGGVQSSGRVVFATPGSFAAVPVDIVNPSPAANDRFGSSLAMQRYADGTIDLWVGAGGASTAAGIRSGALYLFRRGPDETNFRLIEADITLPGARPDDSLGALTNSIAIKGRTLVVGAVGPAIAPSLFDSGVVRVLRRSPTGEWSLISGAIVVPETNGFALTVATNGGRIIVGEPGEGRAVVHRIAGQQLVQESVSVQPDPDSAGGRYGSSVAIGTGTQPAIVVGAADDRIGDLEFAGSAYGFSGSWDACAADLDESGSVGLVDLSILLASWGTPGLVDGAPSADLDADGLVKSSDMQRLLLSWGDCSE